MRADEVVDTDVVADKEGGLWAHVRGSWAYATDDGTFTDSDTRDSLPEDYQPYIALNTGAVRMLGIRRG